MLTLLPWYAWIVGPIELYLVCDYRRVARGLRRAWAWIRRLGAPTPDQIARKIRKSSTGYYQMPWKPRWEAPAGYHVHYYGRTELFPGICLLRENSHKRTTHD